MFNRKKPSYNSEQVEKIVNKAIPLLSKGDAPEYIKGILFVRYENCKSYNEFLKFVTLLIKTAGTIDRKTLKIA